MADSTFHPLQSTFDWSAFFKKALSNGGEWADLFWERSTSTIASSQARSLRQLSSGVDEGVGLRIIAAGSVFYGYTNDLSQEGLNELARRVSQQVRSGKIEVPDRFEQVGHDLGFKIGRSSSDEKLNVKLDLLRRVEKEAWSFPVAKQVSATFTDTRRQAFIARADGKFCVDDKAYLNLVCSVMGQSEQAGTQNAFYSMGGFWGLEQFDQDTPELLAQKTLRQLEVLLKSVPAPSGVMPVVMSAEAGGTMCHEAVGHGLEADLAGQGLSVYADRVGQKVASEKITVVDDGTLAFRRGTHAFDDEGNPTQRTVLIENGILKSYMYDQRMALQKQTQSTGNGRRQTYKHAPMVRMTNTFIAPGKDNPEKILRDTPWGFYVKQMGGGQVDTVSGDFVFNVREGYLIRDGELAEAVQGATLVGNGPRVLQEADLVGSDLGWANGTCGKNAQSAPVTDAQPTLRIPALTIGGRISLKEYFPGQS